MDVLISEPKDRHAPLMDNFQEAYEERSFLRRWRSRSSGQMSMKVIVELVLVLSISIFAGLALLFYCYGASASEQRQMEENEFLHNLSKSIPRWKSLQNVQVWSDWDFVEVFEEYINDFEKKYNGQEEYDNRLQVFKEHLRYIDIHNKQHFSYNLGVNQFSDSINKEFKKHYTGHLQRNSNPFASRDFKIPMEDLDLRDLPISLDWRQLGCVNPARDQGKCGSCYTFAAVAVVEGISCARTGILPDLSEQQIVDCAKPEGNLGCGGGNAEWAWNYVESVGGLCSEIDYPYKAKEGKCHDKSCKKEATLNEIFDLKSLTELSIMTALQKGPVAVAIQGDQIGLQLYKEGVFDGTCGDNLNHAVTIVGYGTDSATLQDYWIVKNSWGESWGENGFFRLIRNFQGDGECGVMMEPAFADFEPSFF